MEHISKTIESVITEIKNRHNAENKMLILLLESKIADNESIEPATRQAIEKRLQLFPDDKCNPVVKRLLEVIP